MIELNHEYTTQELAKEFGVSYNTFRRFREKYEKHLSLFYDFKITKKGPATLYIPIEQYGEFIPLKEYTKNKRNELIKQKAKAVIANNPRQTGSNIARIIYVEKEIQALNCKLSTITNYTRANLKELINSGYYLLMEYKWCFLDPEENAYIEMTDEQVAELRSYFREFDNNYKEEQEEAVTKYKEGLISKQQVGEVITDIKINGYAYGVDKFCDYHDGRRPIKVPLYVRSSLIEAIE